MMKVGKTAGRCPIAKLRNATKSIVQMVTLTNPHTEIDKRNDKRFIFPTKSNDQLGFKGSPYCTSNKKNVTLQP